MVSPPPCLRYVVALLCLRVFCGKTRLICLTLGCNAGKREEAMETQNKWAWHLESVVHNVLNVRHKGRWHAFNGELGQIGTRVRLQRLLQQTQGLMLVQLSHCWKSKSLAVSGMPLSRSCRIRGRMYNSLLFFCVCSSVGCVQ